MSIKDEIYSDLIKNSFNGTIFSQCLGFSFGSYLSYEKIFKKKFILKILENIC